jgi:hypothetical protein
MFQMGARTWLLKSCLRGYVYATHANFAMDIRALRAGVTYQSRQRGERQPAQMAGGQY